MSNSLCAVIGADTTGFNKAINDARSLLSTYAKEAKVTGTTIDEVTSAQVTSFQRVVKELNKVNNGSLSTSKAQKVLAAQIQELKIQWANLSDVAKNGDFGKAITNMLHASETSLEQMKTQCQQASKELGNIGDSTVSVAKPKTMLKSLQNELTKLTIAYRQMSAQEKASAEGQELQKKMSDLRVKAGNLKDTISDVSAEVTVMASDTPNLDLFNSVLGIGADALSTYSSIIAKVTGDEESLKNAISTVMAVQSAANLMTKVTNALQSQSVIMLKLRQVQEGAAAVAIKLKTAAEGKGTVITKAATVAQAAFNAVAKANPYVLLASAVLAVGTAIYAFTKKTKATTEATEDEKTSVERLNEKLKEEKEHREDNAAAMELEQRKLLSGESAQEAYTNTLNDTLKSLIGSYTKLKSEWKSLRTEQEKNSWLKNNKTKVEEFGTAINSVADAERVFSQNTSSFVDAIKKRAEGMAKIAMMAELYKQQIALMDKLQEQEALMAKEAASRPKVRAGQEITDETHKSSRYGSVNSAGKWVYSEAGAKLNNTGTSTTNPVINKLQAKLDNVTKEIDKLARSLDTSAQPVSGTFGEKPTKTTTKKEKKEKEEKPTVDINPDSEKYYEEVVKKLQEDLNNTPLYIDGELNPDYTQTEKELKVWQDKLKNFDLIVTPVVKENDIKKIKESLNKGQSDLAENKQEHQIGETKVEAKEIDLDNLKDELDYQQSIVDKLQEQYDLIQKKNALGGTLNADENELATVYDNASKSVKTLNEQYSKSKSELKLLDKQQQAVAYRQEAWNDLNGTVNQFGSYVSAAGNDIKKLTDDDASGLDKVSASFDLLSQTASATSEMIQSIQTVIEAFSAANAAASQANATAAQAETQANVGKAISSSAAAMGEAAAAGAPLPPPANIAAIAAGVAAVSAVIATIFSLVGSFAEGGIIGGSTSIGDYNLARVNKGEMIINGSQQKRLFNTLNGAGAVGLKSNNETVQFKIKGKNLVGVQKNYYKIKNRL